jgi:hypothetical protein
VLEKLPPNSHLRSPSSYFRWTVRAHNEINRHLGKKIMSLREAKRIWKFPKLSVGR